MTTSQKIQNIAQDVVTSNKRNTVIPSPDEQLVVDIEDHINQYVTFRDGANYSLPLALWTIGTYCFLDCFDAFPYMCITSSTKRSGKTRLAETLATCCANPRNMSAITGPGFFIIVETEHPTIFYDEAETLNSESASTIRQVLNVGYRKGQLIPRVSGKGTIRNFDTYSPKVFILIGSVYDTLRDRSIEIVMQRGEAKKRWVAAVATEEGKELRERISDRVRGHLNQILHGFRDHQGLDFLQDRDEEIWTSLFVLCSIFCPGRIVELERICSDMCADKTSEAQAYRELEKEKVDEQAASDYEYGKKCLVDLWSLFVASGSKVIFSRDIVEKLKEIPTSPWRKFRGKGLTMNDVSNLLSRFKGLKSCTVSLPGKRGAQPQAKGFKREDVERAINTL